MAGDAGSGQSDGLESTAVPPLNTDEGMMAFLARNYPQRRYTSIEQLSGGNVNHVWRVFTAPEDTAAIGAPSTEIIKHAMPYLRFNPGVAFPTERMDFEARALQRVPAILCDESAAGSSHGVFQVFTPRVLGHFPDHAVLHLSDGGQRTLKAAYDALSAAQVCSAGVRLARWLALLHARTGSVDIGRDGHAQARGIYRYAYQGVAGAWEAAGVANGAARGREVDERYGALLLTDDECVAHGDFWPGNMLVGDEGADEVPVTVVDWEIVRRGVGATDVAQFAAEAYLLDRFRGVGHGLAAAFLRSYIAEMKPDERFWERFGVHWAVHVSFWPTFVTWGSEKETRELSLLGVETVEVATEAPERLAEFLLAKFDQLRRL